MSTGLKANSDGSAAIQVGGTDVITLTSGGAATFVTSPTTVQAGTAAAPSITFSGDTNTGIYSPGADTIAFTEGGVESMRIDSSGNLLVGTTTASSKLTVNSEISIGADADNRGIVGYTPSRFYIGTRQGGVNYFDTINVSSGNVGIGTTSPSHLLQATKNQNATTRIAVTNSDTTNTSSRAAFQATSGTVNCDLTAIQSLGAYLGTSSNHDLNFVTNGSTRATINSAGYSKFSDNGTYLGAGNTFHEFRQSVNDVNLIVHSTSTSLTDNVMYVRASRNTTNNTFYAFGYYNDAASAYKMRVADSGTITNTTGTYTTISDIKLKQDIVDASSQWDDIKALRIVKYRLKEYVQNDPDSKPFLGLIAQEVEQVCPSLVEEQEDEVMDEDGKLVKNGEVTKGVKTSILYMKAVKALQEAMTRIETLEAEVAALKGAA